MSSAYELRMDCLPRVALADQEYLLMEVSFYLCWVFFQASPQNDLLNTSHKNIKIYSG